MKIMMNEMLIYAIISKTFIAKFWKKTLSLEQFLTPEIMNSGYVQSKKLSNLDSERDNVPITHNEFTKALGETKIGLSPGLDGYTYTILVSMAFNWTSCNQGVRNYG